MTRREKVAQCMFVSEPTARGTRDVPSGVVVASMECLFLLDCPLRLCQEANAEVRPGSCGLETLSSPLVVTDPHNIYDVELRIISRSIDGVGLSDSLPGCSNY